MKTVLGMMTAAAIAGFATVAAAETPAPAPDYTNPTYEPVGVFIDNPKGYSYERPKKDECFFTKEPFFKYTPGKDVRIKEKEVKIFDKYNPYPIRATLITAKCKIPLRYPVYKKIVLYDFKCLLIDKDNKKDNHVAVVMEDSYDERVLYADTSRFTIKKKAKFAELKCTFLDRPDREEPNGAPSAEEPTEEETAAPPA